MRSHAKEKKTKKNEKKKEPNTRASGEMIPEMRSNAKEKKTKKIKINVKKTWHTRLGGNDSRNALACQHARDRMLPLASSCVHIHAQAHV